MTKSELDRFRRIELLFSAALNHPSGDERTTWLRAQCGHDSTLVQELLQLLQYDDQVTAVVPSQPEAFPTFGAWQAVRLLGRGGMGVVYLAKRADGAFQMTAAVKVVPLALASLEIEERFRRERQFLASLHHPRIARLLDGGVTTGAGLPYLVMEFIDGVNIQRYCEERQLPERARIELMRQVLDALVYVHAHQVVHRDLKPSNILVDSAGEAKLLDFGTARLVDTGANSAITQTGVFAFTPDYASPEQVQGKPVTYTSDIYSAGLLLNRLLTGHSKLEPSALASPIAAILSKALRAKPEERYASAAEMDADLARYLAGQPVSASSPLRMQWIALAIAAALLFVAATYGWFLHRNAAPRSPGALAVLPFANGSGNSADQYFSDGLAGEITDALSRIHGLQVIGRSAAFQFRGKAIDFHNVGKQLDAAYLLEGSAEHLSDHVKIVASLRRVSDNVVLWTNTYQRLAADTSNIETDLELAVLASLKIPTLNQPKTHVPPEEAHEYYLKARFQGDQISMAANTLSQQYYRRAIELDPKYAAAYDGLSAAIWNRNNADGEPFHPEEIRESEKALEKALELDPGLVKARVGLAMTAMRYDWDWSRAERELRVAETLDPFTGTEINYASVCLVLGRRQEARQHFQRARDLDSLSSQAVLNEVQYLTVEGRFAEARDEVRKIAARSPNNERLQVRLNFMEAWFGNTAARDNLRKWSQQRPYSREFLAYAEAHNGNRQEALRLLIPLEQEHLQKHIPVYGLACIRAALNDEPNTVKLLETALDSREDWAPYIHVDAAFARMRNTPDFHRLKKRMGLDW